MRRQSTAKAGALARDISAQSCNGTTVRAIGAVPVGQIVGDEIAQIPKPALCLGGALQGPNHGLGRQVLLRSKMTVEATMCEASAVHDLVDTDAIEAFLAKKPRSRVNDSLAVLRCLLPAHPHPFRLSRHIPLTEYMTRTI